MAAELLQLHRDLLDSFRSAGLFSDLVIFEPYITTMAGYLPNNHEALMRFSRGLQVVTDALIKKPDYRNLGIFYQILSSMSAIRAFENGVDPEAPNLKDYNKEINYGGVVIKPDQILTINEAEQVAGISREAGMTIGLLHGHFRLLTPSSIAYIINACDKADVMLVGIELGDRTLKYKGKELILTDSERFTVFRQLTPFVFGIDDTVDYSDAGYQQLCATLNPDFYLGQSDNPPELKVTMKKRAAKLPKCTYVELTNMPGLSTTEIKSVLDQVNTDS